MVARAKTKALIPDLMDDIASPMLYRIMLNGVAIEADSPEAAVALAKATAAQEVAPNATRTVSNVVDAEPEQDRWAALLSFVSEQQRAVLVHLKAHPKGISGKDLALKMGEEKPMFITGVIYGGLVKNLRRANIERSEVFLTKDSGKGGLYLPGPMLEANEVTKP